jgi:hypothetical protein
MQRASVITSVSLGRPAGLACGCSVTPGAPRRSSSASRPSASDSTAACAWRAQGTRCAAPLTSSVPPSARVCSALPWPCSISVNGPWAGSGTGRPAADSSCAASIVSASGKGTCQWPRPAQHRVGGRQVLPQAAGGVAGQHQRQAGVGHLLPQRAVEHAGLGALAGGLVDLVAEEPGDAVGDQVVCGGVGVHRRSSPLAMMPRRISRVPPRRLNDGTASVA